MNHDIHKKVDRFVDITSEYLYQKSFPALLTFDECAEYYHEAKKAYPHAVGLVLAVKKNYDPRNENDKLIVILGLIDANNKPITSQTGESVSKIVHTKTVDTKIINLLNGRDAAICIF